MTDAIAAGIAFTRCRPYRKNDQAWVEQKNGAVVRRIVGYRRFEGLAAAAALAELYVSVRLFVNFFQPSFKLAEKTREGAKVYKRYHPPATPYQRLMADPRASEEVKRQVEAQRTKLDPVRLLSDIRAVQQRLVEIADTPEMVAAIEQPSLEQFLTGLRTAWQEGEVRPTARPKQKAKRLRRRPDPFAAVTEQLHSWFEAEPWRTSRELFERLQAEQPGAYGDGQLRTLQRRLKGWRREVAHRMVFGATHHRRDDRGCHANGLSGGVAITDLGHVPSDCFGIPVLDDGEQPDFAIQHGRDLRGVGAPHQVRRIGGDVPVMGFTWPREVAVRRQQAVLAHQPQHSLAGNPKPIENAQPRPYLAMTLTDPGRTSEIGADCAQ